MITITVMAGNNDFITVSTDQTILPNHVNQYKTALGVDWVPRTVDGVVSTMVGSFGSSTYGWLKMFVASGYWEAGDIKLHHSYNGTVGCGQGWFLMDGTVVNESNYDAQAGHTAGDWDAYVVSSPFENLYVPDMDGRYIRGVETTPQDGATPFSSTGNGSNQVDLSHTHTVTSHTHQWYDWNNGANDDSYNSGGASTDIATAAAEAARGINAHTLAGSIVLGDSGGTEAFYTDAQTPGTDSQLSATQNIAPESHVLQFCLRIVE